jgi:hypothetical protein
MAMAADLTNRLGLGAIKEFEDGQPCGHPGCMNHATHPCEGCGRIGGRSIQAYIAQQVQDRTDVNVTVMFPMVWGIDGVPSWRITADWVVGGEHYGAKVYWAKSKVLLWPAAMERLIEIINDRSQWIPLYGRTRWIEGVEVG